jgi:hypothetical protein
VKAASRACALVFALAVLVSGGPLFAYPLDGYPQTGIIRLEAYRLAAQGTRRPDFLSDGELLPSDWIELRLARRGDFTVPAPDPELSRHISEMLGADASSYGVTVLDYSDPAHPRYAAVNPEYPQQPGSVGKVVVLLGWFQALADLYPDDVAARRRLLHDTEVTADAFIRTDEHEVPFWHWGDTMVDRRPLAEGDRANLWTFLDWAASASSNAAGSMLMEQLVLLRHFGRDYPVSPERAAAFLRDTPKAELSRILADALDTPLRRNGLDPSRLRQGSFFTREGKQRIPGVGSVATAAELMHYIVLLEQGKLVDAFSSLEIKKLLYLTDNRIRYASAPILADHAVFLKSGSLYGCKPERGFQCTKFHGNRMNFMNSMAMVETVHRDPHLRYAVVVLSNVLKRDSAELHADLAARIHHIIESFHPER